MDGTRPFVRELPAVFKWIATGPQCASHKGSFTRAGKFLTY